MRIFIVEDEAIIAMDLEDRLQSLGYEVCGRAACAEQALAKILPAKPDLVLMDVNLGRGISGIDVADHLHGQLDAPIIFLSAYTSAELEEKASQSREFQYIVKPFRMEALRARIEAAYEHHRAMKSASS